MGAQRPASEVETIVTPTTMPIWTTADPRPASTARAAGREDKGQGREDGGEGRDREEGRKEDGGEGREDGGECTEDIES